MSGMSNDVSLSRSGTSNDAARSRKPDFEDIPLPRRTAPIVAVVGSVAVTIAAIVAAVVSGGILVPFVVAGVAAIGTTSAALCDEVRHSKVVDARKEVEKHAIDSWKEVELKKEEHNFEIQMEKLRHLKDSETKRMEIEVNERRKISCETCKGYFNTSEALTAHFAKYHAKKLECRVPNCNGVFESQESYDVHMNVIHSGFSSLVKVCPFQCKMLFLDNESLILHIKQLHTETQS